MAQKCHQETPVIKTNLLRVDPKFLRNMCFTKKHNQKSLKRMQANNAKTMNACAKAVKSPKPKEVKPRSQRVAFALRFIYFVH